MYDARLYPREGGQELSAKKRSESDARRGSSRSKKPQTSDKKPRNRSGDLGRALRSIYDDTLRESIPDDFVDLIGKLS